MRQFIIRRIVLSLLMWMMLPCCVGHVEGNAVSHPLRGAPTRQSTALAPPLEVSAIPKKACNVTSGVKRKHQWCMRCEQLPRTTVFLPCSHRLMCAGCADVTENCPLCEQTILGTVIQP